MAEIPINLLSGIINGKVDKIIRAANISLFNGVIRDTRVKTGRMRGNWQTTENHAAVGEIERLDKSGAAAMGEVVEKVKSGTTMYLANNLSYAPIWNERDAIVDKNVARLERNFSQAVAKVR